MRKFFLIILGPTAVGKSKVALELSKELKGEIINADSRQVYKDFVIGTGSPKEEDKSIITHHLYNFYDPTKRYSAYLYMKDAEEKVRDIYRKGKLPIVVGGTGLYIRSLRKGLFDEPESDSSIRDEIYGEADKYGWERMYLLLKKIDPLYAEKISKNDRVRIVRALEVYKKTGKPISELFKETKPPLEDFEKLVIGIIDKKKEIHTKIEKRVKQMFKEGFLEEVENLLSKGYTPDIPAFKSIGYFYAYEFIKGRLSYERAVELMIRDTKRYAKRQITWFKKEKGVHWLKPEPSLVLKFVLKEVRWKKLSL